MHLSSFDKMTAQTSAHEIKLRLTTLQRRQKRLYVLAFAGLVLVILLAILSVVQQDLLLSFWDLSLSVQQLHIPASVDLSRFQTSELPHYLGRILSWIGWLILKICAVLLGGFISIRVLKHFGYFRQRFKSLVLKFVAWLISCIVIWSSLSYLQYYLSETEQQSYQVLLSYDENIQESVIAQQLAQGRELEAVKAYLLAQTALLHRPVDRAAAETYMQQLLISEQTQPYFAGYGFKAEQLWAMQQQLYGKSVSPIGQSMDHKALQAKKLSVVFKWIIYLVLCLTLFCTLLSYMLARNIQQRCRRVEQLLQ